MTSDRSRLRLPLVLDGATATEYRRAGMPAGACVELWALEHPRAAADLARRYADAGSDVVLAPTFLANAGQLKAHGLSERVAELNGRLVSIVKEALSGRDTLVAGDLSTTGLTCEPFGETEFVHLIGIYAEQALALAEAGADLLVVETMESICESRAAVLAARQTGLPILLTMTVDEEGRTSWDDDLLAALVTLQDLGVSAFGLNCSQGPEGMAALFERIAPYAKVPLVAKPNAGEPPLSPVQFSDKCARLMRRGVQIVGGCCGAGPDHVAALRHMVDAFDISRVTIKPADYDILAAGKEIYYLDGDLEFSEPITCEVDMADSLLEVSHESCDAVLIHVDTPDDGYRFSLNAHMIDMPVAFESESLEALDAALLYYNGKAILSTANSELEREELEQVAARYGAVVL